MTNPQRPKQVSIAMGDDLYARLARSAAKAGVTPTEHARDLILAALGGRGSGSLRRAVLDMARKVATGALS